MAKRKFKEIEKNSEKSSQSPNRSYKRSKLSPGTDSDKMITLTQKKVKARLFDKINVKNKEAYNKLKFNDDSPEEKILVTIQVQKPQTPYSLTSKILKKEKWEGKAIVIKNRTNHWKVQIIEQQNPYSLCKVDTIWKIDKDALKRMQ